MAINLVWLKRDLRLQDHKPLLEASMSGHPVLLVYNFEPMLFEDQHFSDRHWRFVWQSLIDIKSKIPQGALHIVSMDAEQAFNDIHQKWHINALFSYQEIGLNNTFKRDIAIQNWCLKRGIQWTEYPSGAVIRALNSRQHWDTHWQQVMRSSQDNLNLSQINWGQTGTTELSTFLVNKLNEQYSTFQQGGESMAHKVLDSFFQQRGKSYAFSLSSPSLSVEHCSRLSAYLAWGNISLKQVYQKLLSYWHKPGWRRSLVAFSSRLHWHCHFIQKFESECQMEFYCINKGYEALPRVTGDEAFEKLQAWKTGQTGIPMVDACMRSLINTGYLNFRMRAILVSFLTHHLALDWRLGVKHLASVFLDFEPGIHYSQFQMQASVTGINTIRIYNPIKQGEEKDPDGEFIKKWLPELSELPAPFFHTPWLMTPMEQLMYKVELGKDYPAPIIDLKQSYKAAQSLLWQWKSKPQVKIEAKRILAKHVRPTA